MTSKTFTKINENQIKFSGSDIKCSGSDIKCSGRTGICCWVLNGAPEGLASATQCKKVLRKS